MSNQFNNDDQIDLDNAALEDAFAPRVFNANLAALRAQNPFIGMLPFPTTVVAGKLSAGIAQDIQLPEGTKMIRIRAETGKDFWITRNGTAQIPSATPDPHSQAYGGGSLLSPNDRHFYTEDFRSLSMIAAQDTLFAIECFIQM